MRVGTKSLLFGVHQVVLHPLTVALAWWRLYGFPWDPRLWAAFLVHDWGYWGKLNMDGPEGESHPELGARIMGWLFGAPWRDLCLYHSRFYARAAGALPSRLCLADKYSFIVTPRWLYLRLARASGELAEYMERAGGDSRGRVPYRPGDGGREDQHRWHKAVYDYLWFWVYRQRHTLNIRISKGVARWSGEPTSPPLVPYDQSTPLNILRYSRIIGADRGIDDGI